MVLPDTYERQMLWWKSHQEAVSAAMDPWRLSNLRRGLTQRNNMLSINGL